MANGVLSRLTAPRHLLTDAVRVVSMVTALSLLAVRGLLRGVGDAAFGGCGLSNLAAKDFTLLRRPWNTGLGGRVSVFGVAGVLAEFVGVDIPCLSVVGVA